MENLYQHLIVGLILTVIALILLRDLGGIELAAIAVAISFGSLVPDIDHPTSKIRKGFRKLLIVGSTALVYLTITSTFVGTLISEYVSEIWQILVVSIFTGVTIAYVIDRSIPSHRGIIHGALAAMVYAVLCYVAMIILNIGNPLIIAIGGLVGYLSHTITDRL